MTFTPICPWPITSSRRPARCGRQERQRPDPAGARRRRRGRQAEVHPRRALARQEQARRANDLGARRAPVGPDRLITGGGWIARPGATVFNLYRPPTLAPGDPGKAGPWLDHVRLVYPATPITSSATSPTGCRGRRRRSTTPSCSAARRASARTPCWSRSSARSGRGTSPRCRRSSCSGGSMAFSSRSSCASREARDLGDVNRYQFYDHLKAIIAAPPDVLRVDEKNLREYSVPNVCGVVITTNHKTDGIFLPADDRRHYVAWSELTKDDFEADYWARLWSWYDRGGDRHVARLSRRARSRRLGSRRRRRPRPRRSGTSSTPAALPKTPNWPT